MGGRMTCAAGASHWINDSTRLPVSTFTHSVGPTQPGENCWHDIHFVMTPQNTA